MIASPIRVGIIGVHPETGWAATAHIPALQQSPAFRLTAISHHDSDIAQAATAKFGVPHALSSTEALVEHPDVDLVVVAVKVTRHEELVRRAVEAGKAVFSEWPLGMNLDAAVRMRDLARDAGVATAIGLQTRASPPFAYMRDLVRDGFVGEVLSATLIGSGITLGASIGEGLRYTLDPANGVGMQNVTFAHSIDGLLNVLDDRFAEARAAFATRRQTIMLEESGEVLPLTAPDQVVVNGVLENGAVVAAHFRGGLSRGTNFHLEINGTEGDLILTSPVGYVGIGGFRLQGASGSEPLSDLTIPASYGSEQFAGGPAQSLALAYARLASDLTTGTTLTPTFDDAVDLHRLIDALERSAGLERTA